MRINTFLFFALSSYLILSEASVIDDQLSDQREGEFGSRDSHEADKKKFKCPLPFGTFSDPDDCAHYFLCVAGVSTRRKCRSFHQFDILRRTCLPSIFAICDNKNKDKTTKTTSSVTPTTPSGDGFSCPNWMGYFPHPSDCSKYYSCVLYKASLKTCPKSELFDAVKKECKSADKVNCGDRKRPDSTTTSDIITESDTPTEIVTEDTTTTETSTETDAIITTSSPDDITITPTSSTTTTASSPTQTKPTGPPDTDCNENDVDCIIDETGDPDNWFTCPKDIGAYVHPSSNRLFIFCMNWIPSVKKCGMDLVFSEELSTCIEVKYLL